MHISTNLTPREGDPNVLEVRWDPVAARQLCHGEFPDHVVPYGAPLPTLSGQRNT